MPSNLYHATCKVVAYVTIKNKQSFIDYVRLSFLLKVHFAYKREFSF